MLSSKRSTADILVLSDLRPEAVWDTYCQQYQDEIEWLSPTPWTQEWVTMVVKRIKDGSHDPSYYAAFEELIAKKYPQLRVPDLSEV